MPADRIAPAATRHTSSATAPSRRLSLWAITAAACLAAVIAFWIGKSAPRPTSRGGGGSNGVAMAAAAVRGRDAGGARRPRVPIFTPAPPLDDGQAAERVRVGTERLPTTLPTTGLLPPHRL